MCRLLLLGSFLLAVSILNAQPNNNTCNSSEVFYVTSHPSDPDETFETCMSGTTIDADPLAIDYGCLAQNRPAVWYKISNFYTEDVGFYVSASSESENPSIQVFDQCGDSANLLSCVQGENYQVYFQSYTGQDLYIAVSQEEEQGVNFNICVGAIGEYKQCNLERSLTVESTSMGSPLSGPFKPGEEVHFKYEINYWDDTPFYQLLQSIIPVFGNGWDESSLSGNIPINHSLQTPGWQNTFWNIEPIFNLRIKSGVYLLGDYNGDGISDICHRTEQDCIGVPVSEGDELGLGWYARSSIGQLGYSCGDFASHHIPQGTWLLNFSLKTKDFPDCENAKNCTVKIYTLPDGITGGGYGRCLADSPAILSLSASCLGPIRKIEKKICSGDSINIAFDDNGVPADYFSVGSPKRLSGAAVPDDYLSGHSDGDSSQIKQELINHSTHPLQLDYFLFYSEEVYPSILNVTIAPKPFVSPTNLNELVCIGDTISIGGYNPYVNNIGYPYDITWIDNFEDTIRPFQVNQDTSLIIQAIVGEYNCLVKEEFQVKTEEPNLEFDFIFNNDTLIISLADTSHLNIRFIDTNGIISKIDVNKVIFSEEGSIEVEVMSPFGVCQQRVLRKEIHFRSTSTNQLIEEKNLSIQPNPTKGNFTVSIQDMQSEQINLEILNMVGQQIYSQKQILLDNQNWHIPISLKTLPGVYYLLIENESGIKIYKPFIIVK